MLAHKLSPNFEDRFAKIDIGIPKLGDPPILKKELSPSRITNSNSTHSLQKVIPPYTKTTDFIISQSPTKNKKLYPSSLYPNNNTQSSSGIRNVSNTTTSRSPFLSTARRAESKSGLSNNTINKQKSSIPSITNNPGSKIRSRLVSSNSLSSNQYRSQLHSQLPSLPKTPKQNKPLSNITQPLPLNHKASSKSLPPSKQQSHKRYLSCPPLARAATSHALHQSTTNENDQRFSFMRETSSSKNKQSIPYQSPVPTPNPSNPTAAIAAAAATGSRSRSVSDINHKRSSLNGYKKRQLSNNKVPTLTSNTKKAASTPNKSLDSINLNYSTSKFSQLAQDSKLKRNLLYVDISSGSESDISISPTHVIGDEPSVLPKKKEHPYTKLGGLKQQQQSLQHQQQDQSSRSMKYDSKRPSELMTPKQSPIKQAPPPVQSNKINSIRQLCTIVYHQDPSLFEYKKESEDYSFTTNPPFAPQDVIASAESHGEASFNIYERGEILRKKDLYYIPTNNQSTRTINIRSYSDNYGFDDDNGNYVVIPHDHINYRYEIDRVLGNGSFGNVVLCKDHKYFNGNQNKMVALKIIKNDLNWSLQAVYEIKMLKHLNENFKVGGPGINISNFDLEYLREYGNDSKESPVLTYYDHFHFRGHMCIITEVLSLNLYSLLEITKFKGFSINLLKKFSYQILKGLQFIHNNKIIHCDIKPENIMIKFPNNFDPNSINECNDFTIKIIDFGSSCFNNEISYSYIQSRFYRAPEVIIGAKYNSMIDLWSFGCVIAELYTGIPLFPGKNELEQIGLISEVFGAPNSSLIVSQRNLLLRSIRSQNAAKNILDGALMNQNNMNKNSSIDEKSIKRTLLYTLFDSEGKFNLQFLNVRLQTIAQSQTPNNYNNTAPRRNFRLNSKNLEIMLKLAANNEDRSTGQSFIKFLQSIFKWDPNERLNAADLLAHRFLQN